MKVRTILKTLTVIGVTAACSVNSAEMFDQRVTYVGDDNARAKEYLSFLGQHFKGVEFQDRAKFQSRQVDDADVVLLDWPQGIGPFPPTKNPLGARGEWAKPTVLLGSAGLNTAVAWKTVGGSG